MEGEGSRVRATVFSPEEVDLLTAEVQVYKDELESSGTTHARKEQIWEVIGECLFERTRVRRSRDQCRRKWKNMKSYASIKRRKGAKGKVMEEEGSDEDTTTTNSSSTSFPHISQQQQGTGTTRDPVSYNNPSGCLICSNTFYGTNSESSLSSSILSTLTDLLNTSTLRLKFNRISLREALQRHLLCETCLKETGEAGVALQEIIRLQKKVEDISIRFESRMIRSIPQQKSESGRNSMSDSCFQDPTQVVEKIELDEEEFIASFESERDPFFSSPPPHDSHHDLHLPLQHHDPTPVHSPPTSPVPRTRSRTTRRNPFQMNPVVLLERCEFDLGGLTPTTNKGKPSPTSSPKPKRKWFPPKREKRLPFLHKPKPNLPSLYPATFSQIKRRKPERQLDGSLRKRASYSKSLSGQEKVKCPSIDCSYTAPTKLIMDIHVKRRHSSYTQTFPCEKEGCSRKFRTQLQLLSHSRLHNGRRSPYSCTLCSKQFRLETSLKSHVHVMHEGGQRGRPHPCPLCQLRFHTKTNLTKHINRIHHDLRPFLCEYCSKSFTTNDILQGHQARIHPEKVTDSLIQKYQCDICGKVLGGSGYVKLHRMSHTGGKKHKCPEPDCPYSGDRPSSLKEHSKIHSDVREYKCELCPATYKKKAELKIHMQRHNNEKTWACEYCPMTFILSKTKKNHVSVVHFPEVKPFICGGCGEGFPIRKYLNRHLLKCPMKAGGGGEPQPQSQTLSQSNLQIQTLTLNSEAGELISVSTESDESLLLLGLVSEAYENGNTPSS